MQDLLGRIRGEYMEMPGLRLTLEQARRLCGVERGPCQEVLNALVATNFLRLTPNGAYARCTDGADYPRPHAAKADLGTEKAILGLEQPTGSDAQPGRYAESRTAARALTR